MRWTSACIAAPAASIVSDIAHKSLVRCRLKKKLRATESQLNMTELEKSLEELKVFTETNRVRRGLTRELEGARSAAKAAASKAATELAAAKADARKLASQLGAKTVEVTSLRDEVKRRDEQIEFLMQVHDASQECEWVPEGGANEWQCGACTLRNAAHRTKCEACDSDRGAMRACGTLRPNR